MYKRRKLDPVVDGRPDHTQLGILSLAERDVVRRTCARIVSGDHYVGVRRRGSGCDVEFKRSGALATAKEVVVVNCRSSARRVHAFNRDVHPLRPDGSLEFGTLAGFTGHTNYICAAILAKERGRDVFADLALYGRERYAPPREDFVFARTLKIFNNLLSLIPALEMKNYLDPDASGYSINATLWYSPLRRLYGATRLMRARDALREKAAAHLRRLEPGDDQPGLDDFP